jgi:hypothetical protein
MAKVAHLYSVAPSHGGGIAPGPLFEAAWRAWPESGKRRSSRRIAVRAWAIAACECGERELLDAVTRYLKEDPDVHSHTGAPGFHKWMNDARWDYWAKR